MATKDYAEILLETIDRVVAERFSLTYSERSEEDYEIVKTMANPYELVLPDQVSDFGGKSIAVESGKVEIGSFNFTYKDDIKYDRLIIQCELTATGPTFETTTNSYGIQVEVKENGKNYIFQFDSSEMLGNPLAFDGMLQRKICDLGEINSIDSIKLTFYNNTNKTVTFSNIKGTLGYALEDLGEAALPVLIWSDVKEYHTNLEQQVYDLNELNVNLRWIYDNGNTKKVITPSNVDELPEGVCIYWYKYTPGVPQGSDSIGGSYFSRIGTFDGSNKTDPKDGFTFNIFKFIETTQDDTQIKVVICYTKEGTLTEVSSNILKIANIKDTTDERISGKQIKLEDSTSGVYPFYAYDKIYAQDKIYEINKERKAVLDFDCQGKETKEQFFKDIESITWYIPNYNNEKALLLTKDSTGAYKNQLFVINNNSGQDYSEDFFTLYYKLPERAIDLLPNKLKAVIKLKNGTEYEFLKDIQLAVAGDGGTDNSIIIRLYDGAIESNQSLDEIEPVSAIKPELSGNYATLTVTVNCYDFEGKNITHNTELKLSLLTFFLSEYWEEKKGWEEKAQIITPVEKGSNIYNINIYKKYALNNNLAIHYLKADCIINNGEEDSNNQINIEKIIPLPFRSDTKYKYMGPDRIRYNYEGQLISENSLDISILNIFSLEGISTDTIGYNISAPNIKQENSNYKIIPRGLFEHVIEIIEKEGEPPQKEIIKITDKYGINPYVIYGYNEDNALVYVQPIVIEQDVYFSRLINEWDQALKIDGDNNVVLSASLVAGTKNTSNQFTGIIAGDIGKIVSQTTTTKSGLFGYQAGVESYGFNTDGTAFLGQSGAGRINFNGNLGVIYSGNFVNSEGFVKGGIPLTYFKPENLPTKVLKANYSNAEGTFINLKDGILFTNDGIFKGEITTKKGSNIAGWITTEAVFGKMSQRMSPDGYYYGVGLDSSAIGKEQYRVLAIGPMKSLSEDWTKASFYVTGQGKLYASGAEIQGKLNVSEGSNIAGWNITKNSIEKLNELILSTNNDIKLKEHLFGWVNDDENPRLLIGKPDNGTYSAQETYEMNIAYDVNNPDKVFVHNFKLEADDKENITSVDWPKLSSGTYIFNSVTGNLKITESRHFEERDDDNAIASYWDEYICEFVSGEYIIVTITIDISNVDNTRVPFEVKISFGKQFGYNTNLSVDLVLEYKYIIQDIYPLTFYSSGKTFVRNMTFCPVKGDRLPIEGTSETSYAFGVALQEDGPAEDGEDGGPEAGLYLFYLYKTADGHCELRATRRDLNQSKAL